MPVFEQSPRPTQLPARLLVYLFLEFDCGLLKVFREERRSRCRPLVEERDGVSNGISVALRGRNTVDISVECPTKRTRKVVVRAVDTLHIVLKRLDECPVDGRRRRLLPLLAVLAREVELLREVDRLEDDVVLRVCLFEPPVD